MSERKKQKPAEERAEPPGAPGFGACGCVRGFRLCPEALALWEAAERAHAHYLAAEGAERHEALRTWDRAQAAFGFHAPLGPPLRG